MKENGDEMFELLVQNEHESGYEIVKLDSDKIYADAKIEEESNKEVTLSFTEGNDKLRESGKYEIPKPKMYDLAMVEDHSEEIKNVVQAPPVYIHPNDPKLDKVYTQQQVQQQPYIRYNMPIMQHNPVAAVQQSELYRQHQQQRYAMGQSYINQRGPMQYNFNNPNGIPNLRRFQDDMNNIINDPARVMDAVKPNKINTSGEEFVRISGVSKEEYNDRNYERDAKEREEMSKSLKKATFGVPNSGSKDSNTYIPPKHLSYSEMKQRLNNQNTPETSFNNFRTKSGDEFLRIGTSNPVFTTDETSNAFNRAKTEYETQKQAILNKQPLVYSNNTPGYSTPKFYNPNDYSVFMSSVNNSRPKYYAGYGYMSVSGAPDENGLPTVWYDDRGKYLLPTKYDIENERIPIIITNRNKDKPIPEKKDVEVKRTKVEFITSRSKVVDGVEYIDIHDTETNQTVSKVKTDDSYKDYMSMGADAVSQFKKDDTFITTIELSRYNVELADLFCWFKNVLDNKTFILFKRECQDQLRLYRDNDPLCLYKSTVMIVGDNTIVLKPKPTNLKELDDKIKEIKNIDHSNSKLDIIYKKYIEDLNSNIDLEKKLEIIKASRDIEVIKRSDDKALQKAKEIFDKLEPFKKSNFNRYRFWKSIYRSKYMESGIIDKLETEYAEWWNKPRTNMSQDEYDVRYNNRMSRLMEQHLTISKESAPIGNPIFIRNSMNAAKEWERLSEGRFNKPNMTFDDYMVAINVTNFNIEKERIMKRRIDNIKNGKTNTKAFEHSILDKVIDKNVNNLGLSQVMKLPRYAPVSLSGIDKTMDVETRRQKFIDRIFSMKGRPTV